MRLQALVLPALLLALACKSDPGDETGESGGSSTGAAACTVDAVVGDIDPNYPPCDCDYKCEGDAVCSFTAMSSVCEAQCTDDVDCPSLDGRAGRCNGGFCYVSCNEAKPCPNGYVCSENIECQALR